MYTIQQLQKMNATFKWNNRIILPSIIYQEYKLYNIYPTGKADLDGRYWVAIRSEREITSYIKQIYNIL